MRSVWIGVALAVCLSALCPRASGAGPAIQHSGLACIPEEDFAVVAADVSSPSSLRSVKLYFRSLVYAEFYYVEMKEYEGTFIGILPQASEETHEIAYYIEAIDDSFESSRSAEHVTPVRDPCSQRRKAAAYLGDDGGLVVGATTAGASPLPPGFRAISIVGTITAAGAMSSVGGGLGAGTLVVASAAAAGATGAVVVAAGQNPPSTSTSASTSTTSVSAGGATTTPATTTTVPVSSGPPAPPGSTTTISTSTVPSSPGSTTSVSPTTSSIPSSTSSSSSSSSTSTSSSSSTTSTTPPPAPVACFTVTDLGLCRLRLDASCSTGPIDTYAWTFDAGGTLNGPAGGSGQVVTHTYGIFPLCLSREVTNVLTVQGPGGTDTTSQTYRFSLQRTDDASLDAHVVSLLVGDPPQWAGALTINGVTRTVAGASPLSVPFRGAEGANTVEARVEGSFAGTGSWSFDFEQTRRFVPGSLAVEQGELLALTPTRIVFRIDAARPAPIRFRFQLAPGS